MPEYRTPGVYVEETSAQPKAIVRAPTAITAFVGPTASGPEDPAALPALFSFADFERVYGGFMPAPAPVAASPLAYAAHAFFAAGGRRLHVARVPAAAADEAYAQALKGLDAIPEIELVAAPGQTSAGITRALVDHVEGPNRYRFAVLDPPPGLSISDVRAFRADYDSSRAALYYPWIVTADPRPRRRKTLRPPRITLPPSAFACAAYASTDLARGVWKAPANLQVIGALDLQSEVNFAEQEVLNPLGVNVIRSFDARGIRIWGARTITSDPEMKYVNVRRLISHIEASLDRGLGWVVFEPNAEALWTRVVRAVSDFLTQLWRDGALQGATPDQAFFVRCDRTTMTAADIASGRLVCLLGVAVVKPAEFIILRVGQLTVDAQG